MTPSDVTLVEDAIHNPNEPRHFMQLTHADGHRRATVNSVTIASSADALIVREVGRGVYDPVVYFLRSDVDMSKLRSIDKTTHCPLKGDTVYFDIDLGDDRVVEAAWSYSATIEVAERLRDLIAFDSTKVTIA